MNKILLNILIFVGFQQLILGANINKDPEPKLGICLFCYTENLCEHTIVEPCTSKTCKNALGTCVKKVYSACSKGHTMCADCIYGFVENGLNNEEGIIKCIGFNLQKSIGGKNFEECKELIAKEVVLKIFDIIDKDEKERKNLHKKYKKMEEKLQNERLFLKPQNKRCQYKDCLGYFNVTQSFICKQNEKHKHCGKCFDKSHKGECKDPLKEYEFYIQQNEDIQKKIKNKQLKSGDVEGYKPCPNCHQIIAKAGGCNHMTCGAKHNGTWQGEGCGYQWCWRCGKACFCNDEGEPGHLHYRGNQNGNEASICRQFPYTVQEAGDEYFNDGDYFGIKNGKFKEQYKKLANDLKIDVTVETPYNKPWIKIIEWNKIIEARNKYTKGLDDRKNYCTECCCQVFTSFQ